MKLGYKKWFSILGLLAAIMISLFIGLVFDLSILEGVENMSPGEEDVNPEGESVTPEGEEVTPEGEEVTPEGEEVKTGEPDMTLADMSDYTPSLEKKRGESIYNNIMNAPKESFSLIQKF